jgi:hypothetical protein
MNKDFYAHMNNKRKKNKKKKLLKKRLKNSIYLDILTLGSICNMLSWQQESCWK